MNSRQKSAASCTLLKPTTLGPSLPVLLTGCLLFPATLFAQQPEVTPQELPTITVSANPLAPSLLEYGKPISIMEEDEVERRMEPTLGETLRLEPGVRSSFFGQGSSRPVIRGFGGDRVRVLKNGVTTGDISDISEDHVVVADPMQAQQIEILRGPETLLYGSSAIGGAVNVTDDSIPETSLGKPFEGKVLGQFGNSADNEKTVGAKLRAESGSVNWHLSGFSRNTDDYEIPGFAESSRFREMEELEHHEDEDEDHHEDAEDEEREGKLENSDTESWGATAGTSYVWDKGFWGVAVSGFGSDYGVPGHIHVEEEDHDHNMEDHGMEEEEEGEDVRVEAEQLRVDMRGRVDDVSDAIESIKFRMGVTDYEHDEIEGGAVATSYERDAIEARLEFLHAPVASFRGAAGIQIHYDDFSALGEEAFLTPVKTFSPAFFFFEQTELSDSLDFRFGGRVESVRLDPVGEESQSYTPFSLSAGPLWNITPSGEYTLGLTVAYTERAPNAVELFSEGQHLARQIFEVGNSDLDKEASWGIDIALQKNDGLVTGAFTPFYQQFTNYINLAGTGAEDEGLPVYTYEEIDAYFWGFELESALHLDHLFSMGAHRSTLEYQIDYVRARNEDVSGNLPRIPPLRNILRARYQYNERLDAYLEGVFVERQNEVAEFEIPTDRYTLLNAEVSAAIPSLQEKNGRVFLRGTNLTDEEARIHSSFLKDLAPLRGRSFLVGFRTNL